MEEVKFINSFYEESSRIERQGNRDSINFYLKRGYTIQVERNGYWVLVKPSSIRVLLRRPSGEQIAINVKDQILNHYGRQKISTKLFLDFLDDVKKGKIKFYYDEKIGYYFE